LNTRDIAELYAYDRWANARFFDAMSALDGARLDAAIVSSFPSLRSTLAHIVAGEWIWLERWLGANPTEPPAWFESPSIETLRDRLDDVEMRRDRWLSTLDDEALGQPLSYRRVNGDAFSQPLRDTLVHVVNHSTYHRGQLVTMLRQVGATPPGTDFVTFTRQRAPSA